jgi:hypothetical protein
LRSQRECSPKIRGIGCCSHRSAPPALGSWIGPHFGVAITEQPAIAGAQFELAYRPALAAIDQSRLEPAAALITAMPRKLRRRSCSSLPTTRRAFRVEGLRRWRVDRIAYQRVDLLRINGIGENHDSNRHRKQGIAVVLFGPSSHGRILRFPAACVEPLVQCEDILSGPGFHLRTGEPDMPNAVRIAAIAPPTATSKKSESNDLVSIALFCGIGLLVSLVAILMGVPGAWY